MVTLTIDNQTVRVAEGTTILEAAKSAGIIIPHLCYLKELNEIAACRVCSVEVEGETAMVTACNSSVVEGMVVHTNSPRARETRRINVELILSQHDCLCATCVRSGSCQLQRLANSLGIIFLPYERDCLKAREEPGPQPTLSTEIIKNASNVCAASRSVTRCRPSIFGTLMAPDQGPRSMYPITASSRTRTALSAGSASPTALRQAFGNGMTRIKSTVPLPILSSFPLSKSRRRSAQPYVKPTEFPPRKHRWENWPLPCAVWAFAMFMIRALGPTLPSWKKPTNFSRNLRTVRQRNSPYLQAAAPAGCAFSKESSRN